MINFYPWFQIHFPLFQTHYHTLPRENDLRSSLLDITIPPPPPPPKKKGKIEFELRLKYTSNCTFLAVSPPIYEIGKKKPEKKIQGFNVNNTRHLARKYVRTFFRERWGTVPHRAPNDRASRSHLTSPSLPFVRRPRKLAVRGKL